ncbi:MAG TPA: hypothetical protein VFZ69_12420 [Longimicrobiales bacterium]
MQRSRSGLVLCCILAVTSCSGGEAADGAAVADEASPALEAALTPGPGEPNLAAVRAATERFVDVNVALAEGYVPDPSGMCITAEMEGLPAKQGAMGIHYFRPDLLGLAPPQPEQRVNGTSTYTDFNQPAILLYEPQADGSLELVGVENLVFQKSWAEAGNTSPPMFHNVAYKGMMDDPATEADEAHGFEPHYEAHVWIYRENPNGVFTPFNPNVTCANAAHAAH